MRDLRTIGIAAVAAAALAISGAAWAQQAPKGSTVKESSASTSTANCVKVKGGDCVKVKGGSTLNVKAASSKSK